MLSDFLLREKMSQKVLECLLWTKTEQFARLQFLNDNATSDLQPHYGNGVFGFKLWIILLERIYNTHYDNGVPAMFTSWFCLAER